MPRPQYMHLLLLLALCCGTLTAGDAWPTEAEIAAITYEDCQDDNGFVGPFAHDFSRNDEFPERKTDWQNFVDKLNKWEPGKVTDELEQVQRLGKIFGHQTFHALILECVPELPEQQPGGP